MATAMYLEHYLDSERGAGGAGAGSGAGTGAGGGGIGAAVAARELKLRHGRRGGAGGAALCLRHQPVPGYVIGARWGVGW